MKPEIFFLLVFLFPSFLSAQFSDSFADGNFTTDPAWQGNSDRFSVIQEQLRLADDSPGSANEAYLSVFAPTSAGDSTVWEFFFQMDFAPSASNFCRIYLSASNPDLTGEQEGYFLQAGGISGDEDALELYRQDGKGQSLLLSGTAGALGQAPAGSRVRVTRNKAGRWALWADYQGGEDYRTEGETADTTYRQGLYFGFYCRYSSSRSKAFGFDDIRIAPLFSDNEPPRLLSATPISANTVYLEFDEPLLPTPAGTADNFFIDGGIGTPARSGLSGENPARIELELGVSLLSGNTYTVTARNIADAAGNVRAEQEISFFFLNAVPATKGDLIFTEIMADPAPSQGVLPEAEYVEIFHSGEEPVDLAGLAFSTGGSLKSLPQGILLPGDYAVLCDQEDAGLFSPFGKILPIIDFPSITNGGDQLLLANDKGDTLSYMEFRADWYSDPQKADGGWSLERLSADLPGQCAGNWRAALDRQGGTPGKINSLTGEIPEKVPPNLLRAAVESPWEIMLFFDDQLDMASAADPGLYSLDNGIEVTAAFPQAPDFRQVLLFLGAPLSEGVTYTVTVDRNLSDCLGNTSSAEAFARTGLPSPIAAGDIILNEILPHPQTGGADYIELYNPSDKIVDLEGLLLANTQKTSGNISATVSTSFLLFPGEYAVLSEDPLDISARYQVAAPSALLKNDLPTLDAQSGNLTLKAAGITIDSFDYNEAMHFPLLSDTRGVSLERISFTAATQDPGNWHSAASTAGYGTPTGENSQVLTPSAPSGEIFHLPNRTFSPDQDGFEDILLIEYRTDRPGFVLNLRVFDAEGRLINTLSDNVLLSGNGLFQWDGTTSEGKKARIGVYVLWFELFNQNGEVMRQKETCVLAGKL